MKFYQQGDVLLVPRNIPKDTVGTVGTDGDVLQEGEHTGHAHRLYGEGFTVFEHPKTRQKHLRIVKGPVALRHEEHNKIDVPPGDYEVRIVREYDHFDEEARQVAD